MCISEKFVVVTGPEPHPIQVGNLMFLILVNHMHVHTISWSQLIMDALGAMQLLTV